MRTEKNTRVPPLTRQEHSSWTCWPGHVHVRQLLSTHKLVPTPLAKHAHPPLILSLPALRPVHRSLCALARIRAPAMAKHVLSSVEGVGSLQALEKNCTNKSLILSLSKDARASAKHVLSRVEGDGSKGALAKTLLAGALLMCQSSSPMVKDPFEKLGTVLTPAQKHELQFATDTWFILTDEEETTTAQTVAELASQIIAQKAGIVFINRSQLALLLTTKSLPDAEWICLQASPYLFVLIPRTYNGIQELKTYQPNATTPGNKKSPLAYQLGINIDACTRADLADVQKCLANDPPTCRYPDEPSSETDPRAAFKSPLSKHVGDLLSATGKQALLIPRRAYHLYTKAGASGPVLIPKLAIVMIGHGQPPQSPAQYRATLGRDLKTATPDLHRWYQDQIQATQKLESQGVKSVFEGTIAGFDLQDFMRVHEAFKNLWLSLLFIDSCYSPITRISDVQKNAPTWLRTAAPFTTITGAFTATTIETQTVNQWNTFARDVRSMATPDLKTLIGLIYPFQVEGGAITNKPWKQLKGTDIPQPLEQDQTTITIGATQAITRDVNNPLYLTKKTNYIAWQTPIFPGILQIDKMPGTFPVFVSLAVDIPVAQGITGAVHEIAALNAPDWTLTQVLEGCAAFEDLKINRLFVIEKMTTAPTPVWEVGAPKTMFKRVTCGTLVDPTGKTAERFAYVQDDATRWITPIGSGELTWTEAAKTDSRIKRAEKLKQSYKSSQVYQDFLSLRTKFAGVKETLGTQHAAIGAQNELTHKFEAFSNSLAALAKRAGR